jgi:hypothetical protein
MAISPHVMSTPNPLQMRRNGRLPTVVSGARYDLPSQWIRFFSCGLDAMRTNQMACVTDQPHAPQPRRGY